MRRLASAAAGLLIAAAASAEAPFDFARTPGVLPKSVVPVEYALHLVPDVGARTFSGRMTITMDVRTPTSTIVLHALNLEIEPALLHGRKRAPQTLTPVVNRDRQTVEFAAPTRLAPGRYTLKLAWRGKINGAVEGLYADRYRGADGVERMLLATDLEPTGARRILPCWDEPAFRARFRLSVDLPRGDAAVSNMPVARSVAGARGGRRLFFAATPKMASYLLVLVAGDLERSSKRVDGTELGVVTTRGHLDRTAFPLAASGDLLRWFNGYFATRYPLPKLDQIAIPTGFLGGMENWGGIVYNDSALLVDPRKGAESVRQRSFGLAAHEIAHQWFGNLVTMAWWDNLWLNEAFANWIGYKATDRFHPQWQVWLRVKASSEKAMALDARASTHPIQQAVERDSEAQDAFDAITYDKGSAFLRMLEAYLGEAPFREGIRAYLRRHRYSNTTSADLWAALERASGKPVGAIAADWTTRPGFPLVDVDERCEGGRRTVLLRQQRFRAARSGAGDDGGSDRPWSVPIEASALDSSMRTTTLLREAAATAVLDDGCKGVLIVDRDDVGFFRVRYAPALFARLAASWPALPDATRLKLLADTSALVRADQLALSRWLDLLAALPGEPRLAIWEQLLRDLDALDELSQGEPARAALHRFARELIAPRFAALGWDERAGESLDDALLRGRLAAALARYGDAAAIAEGRARFARFAAAPSSLAPALVAPVFEIAGRSADAPTYDALTALARQATTSEERFRAYRAMARAADPALAARSVQLALDPAVPQIMRHEMLPSIARAGHRRLAWDYARDNVVALLADMKLYEGGQFFTEIVESSADATIADELETFALARLTPDALVEVRRGEDEIRTRAAMKARLLPQLEAALAPR